MKRKQFLNRLLKISQLHDSLNPIREIALISTKPHQTKEKEMKPEPIVTRILPCELTKEHVEYISIKNREMVIIKQELITSKVLIHAKGNHTTCKRIPSNRRMKTTPTHSKLNASQFEDISKLIEESCQSSLYEQAEQRRHQYASVDLNLTETLPHYLEIKELQPRAPPRRINIKESPTKRASAKLYDFTRQSQIKKHSLTEPAELTSKKDINTQRKLQLQPNRPSDYQHKNSSNRSESFKKYQSVNEHLVNREKLQQNNKIKLSVRKEINKNYTKHFMPPPKLTAKAYIIYEVKPIKEESRVIVAFNSKNSQEVASLTKIMTCILTLEVCSDFKVDKGRQQIVVGKIESNVGGTSASLAYGEIYTIEQLLFGLMLPSGNDASMALAIWGGRKLLEREQEPQSKFTRMECYNRFIQLMNSKAKELKMLKTNYANSHGLMNPNNKSSAYDLALLCEYAMNNESFRAIVRCKQYKGVVRFNEDSKKIEERTYKKESEEAASESDSPEERSPLMRQFSSIVNKNSEKRIAVEWENTHKLLHLKPKEYIGIKTGYTPSAGPCLSSFISTNNRNFVIIVLGCGRVSLRFKETQILRKWLFKHENLKKKKAKTVGSELLQQQQEFLEQQVDLLLENMKVDEEKED